MQYHPFDQRRHRNHDMNNENYGLMWSILLQVYQFHFEHHQSFAGFLLFRYSIDSDFVPVHLMMKTMYFSHHLIELNHSHIQLARKRVRYRQHLIDLLRHIIDLFGRLMLVFVQYHYWFGLLRLQLELLKYLALYRHWLLVQLQLFVCLYHLILWLFVFWYLHLQRFVIIVLNHCVYQARFDNLLLQVDILPQCLLSLYWFVLDQLEDQAG